MINIENVSMKFNLGIEKDFSIKQAFVNLFTKKGKRKKEELTKEEELEYENMKLRIENEM